MAKQRIDVNYREAVLDMPWCQACGRGRSMHDPPACWCGPRILQRAHLSCGSGAMLRAIDRRAILVLCPVCHFVHRHGRDNVTIGGQQFRPIHDCHMLWLKQRRDPDWWDLPYLRQLWNHALPRPTEPDWLASEYEERTGLLWDELSLG